MANILSGIPVREKIKKSLLERISKLQKKPVLAVIQVGDREDSNLYIKNKIKFGEEIGVHVIHVKTEKWNEEKIEEKIEEFNADGSVDGIIVQLPLPEEINTEKILSIIKKEKDPEPATARAVWEILDFYDIGVENKKTAVIGQGIIAGRPIADLLEKRGARVTRCDIGTPRIPEIAKDSEILISAVGKAGLITKDYVNVRQIVIDVGISKDSDGKLAGDADFQTIEQLVRAITPVPGGVGPVTVASLFANLLDLVYNK